MSTVIYSSPIFGPIHSRRLGLSLGINLMPHDGKICTFDCIYCECGLNNQRRPHSPRPTREEVSQALETRLHQMQEEGQRPDVLTFAGNGEPTAHPHFPEIIDDTLRLRDKYCPEAKVSVLSNATLAGRPKVHAALMKVDNNILKLDTVSPEYISRVNQPCIPFDVTATVETLASYQGHVIVQTMFMRGCDDEGRSVDNTGDSYVLPWLEAVEKIRPSQVMVYTIDRETPEHGLRKATHEDLDRIVRLIEAKGIKASASY